jgi:prophage antirepressor-like protein
MTNNIQTFDFAPGLSIRAIVQDSQPWFLANEICAALGHSNVSKAVGAHVEPEDKSSISLGLSGSAPLMVNESGLYALIMRSKKPEAKAFQRWVTSAVLPSLRKDGLYIAGQEKPITDDLTLPDLLAQMTAIQVKVDAINAAKLLAFTRHQEEKDARADAFRLMRGGRRCSKAPKKPVLTTRRTTG